jgi:heat shock protein HslJ
MRIVRIGLTLIAVLFMICSTATPQDKKLTVRGKLTRVMAIGGETTGWSIQMDSAIEVEGRKIDSIEVASADPAKLQSLNNKRVEATGTVSRIRGVEIRERIVLKLTDIKPLGTSTTTGRQPKPAAAKSPLVGTEWLLEDLGGAGVIDRVQATLALPSAEKIAGRGSCNRFFGKAEIQGDSIKLGSIGATRMACPEAVMNQETKYLKALEAATRFELKEPYLLIHSTGLEKPLRFTRMAAAPGK